MLSLKINNIKCGFKIKYPKNYLDTVNQLSEFNSIKKTGNIVILRTSSACYIIFSGVYVNVTGVTLVSDITQAITEFYELFNLKLTETDLQFTVDNISANTTLTRCNREWDINYFANQLAKQFDGLILQNTLKFPSVSVRLPLGTVVFFRSKKVNIVGVKNFTSLLFLKYVLQNLQTRSLAEGV